MARNLRARRRLHRARWCRNIQSALPFLKKISVDIVYTTSFWSISWFQMFKALIERDMSSKALLRLIVCDCRGSVSRRPLTPSYEDFVHVLKNNLFTLQYSYGSRVDASCQKMFFQMAENPRVLIRTANFLLEVQ